MENIIYIWLIGLTALCGLLIVKYISDLERHNKNTEILNAIFKKIKSDLELKSSKIQSVNDRLKNIDKSIKDLLGDVEGEWYVTGNAIIDSKDAPKLPSVSERLSGIEDYLNIRFDHSIREERGYTPKSSLFTKCFEDPGLIAESNIKCLEEDCKDEAKAEYPIKKKSKK